MEIRTATRTELVGVLALLAEGQIATRREAVPAEPTAGHRAAFKAMSDDPNQSLVCALDRDEVVGSMQLTFIPGLSRDGAWRLQIEAMRVRDDRRGRGLGSAMLGWALDRARQRECRLVQLTSDGQRVDAHRFYARHGFKPTHVGFKRWLQ